MLAGSGKASAATRSNSAAGVEQPGGGGLDDGDEGVDPLHAERAGGGLAQPGVLRLVQADHRRLGLMTAREQDSLRFWNQGHQRGLGDRRGVRGRILEHLLDVGVAGEDVIADRRGEEDGLLIPGQRRHHRVRVGQEVRRQRVK
jgi:hypothetical protein